jgi:hypothetical protein
MLAKVPTRVKLVAVAILFLGALVFALDNFTAVAHLEAVTFDREPVEGYEQEYGLTSQKSILAQPLDSLGEALLNRPGIVKVDISYRPPDGIDIATNRFTPVCFALDASRGRVVGLTCRRRIIPVDPDQADWEHPLLSGVAIGGMYTTCSDVRVGLIIEQLDKLRDDHLDLYRLIAEIDLSHPNYLLVSVSGLPFKLRLTAERLAEQLAEFIRFVEKFTPRLDSAAVVDMRYEDMIIRVDRDG